MAEPCFAWTARQVGGMRATPTPTLPLQGGGRETGDTTAGGYCAAGEKSSSVTCGKYTPSSRRTQTSPVLARKAASEKR
jgi:hypothetical protein